VKRLRYFAWRLLALIPILAGVTLVTFLISHAIKGDPARVLAGDMADEATLASIRRQFNLDKPLYIQYLAYVSNLAHGNLGISYQSRRPVTESIRAALPATIELALTATLFGTAVAIPLGIVAAVRRNSTVDHIIRVGSVGGVSLPVFWFGLVLLVLFYRQLGWLPAGGRYDPRLVPPADHTGFLLLDSLLAGDTGAFWLGLKHLVLPAFVLGYGYMALVARMVRSSMLEVLSQDYIRTARSKGLRDGRVVYGHALRNAMIPTLTVVGIGVANLLGGAVLTESVFGWPGLGKLSVDATLSLDYPVIMAVTLIITTAYVLVNLVVDVLYGILNPQVR
jgi:peptide/nickel transport system permease protein